MSIVRKILVYPLYVLIAFIKYGSVGALLRAELELFFELFKPLFMMDKTGWSGLLLVVAVVGFNFLVIYSLLRLPIKWGWLWDWLDYKKLSKKILILER
jgi:hypothetical protein